MAVRSPTMVKTDADQLVITWEGLNETGGTRDTGDWVSLPFVEGLTAHVFGNFDTSVTLTLQGTNDPLKTAVFTLFNPAGTAISAFSAAGAALIGARPLFIRPAITADGAGDASDLDCIIVGSLRR